MFLRRLGRRVLRPVARFLPFLVRGVRSAAFLGPLEWVRFWTLLFPVYGNYLRRRSRAAISLKVRPLAESIFVRPGTTDGRVVYETFYGRGHLPPRSVDTGAQVIWDLGANIGLTVAHLASLYRSATIIGVELDAENAALARKNVTRWSARCKIVNAAVWTEDGEASYAKIAGWEYGLRIGHGTEGEMVVPAISLNTLLARTGASQIDYVKMDIEGAEQSVLRKKTEWAPSVRCIGIEVHEPYSLEDCRADLEALGFLVTIREAHGRTSVIGER